jgi:hypothetical protein
VPTLAEKNADWPCESSVSAGPYGESGILYAARLWLALDWRKIRHELGASVKHKFIASGYCWQISRTESQCSRLRRPSILPGVLLLTNLKNRLAESLATR